MYITVAMGLIQSHTFYIPAKSSLHSQSRLFSTPWLEEVITLLCEYEAYIGARSLQRFLLSAQVNMSTNFSKISHQRVSNRIITAFLISPIAWKFCNFFDSKPSTCILVISFKLTMRYRVYSPDFLYCNSGPLAGNWTACPLNNNQRVI